MNRLVLVLTPLAAPAPGQRGNGARIVDGAVNCSAVAGSRSRRSAGREVSKSWATPYSWTPAGTITNGAATFKITRFEVQ